MAFFQIFNICSLVREESTRLERSTGYQMRHLSSLWSFAFHEFPFRDSTCGEHRNMMVLCKGKIYQISTGFMPHPKTLGPAHSLVALAKTQGPPASSPPTRGLSPTRILTAYLHRRGLASMAVRAPTRNARAGASLRRQQPPLATVAAGRRTQTRCVNFHSARPASLWRRIERILSSPTSVGFRFAGNHPAG